MSTKFLLIEDVEHLGRSGDLVNAKPGFARNFLLPRKLAVTADKHTLRMQTRLQEERKKKAILEKQEAEKAAAAVEGVTLTTIVKVDHDGRMYGSVSAHDIVNLLQEQANMHVEKRSIGLKHPIKEVGEHTISLRFKEEVTASITLKIVPEESKHTHSHEPKEGQVPAQPSA